MKGPVIRESEEEQFICEGRGGIRTVSIAERSL